MIHIFYSFTYSFMTSTFKNQMVSTGFEGVFKESAENIYF